MQIDISILNSQILMFITLIIIGYFSRKIKLVDDVAIESLSKIIVNIVLPAMILTLVPSGGSRSDVIKMLPFLACSFGMVFFLVIVGIVSGKLLRLEQPTRDMHTAVVGFSNYGFIGYPLILALYPNEAPLVVACFSVTDMVTFWTIGAALADPHRGEKKKFDFKKFVTPITIAVASGLVLLLLDIHPKNVAWTTVEALGGTCKYFALLYIGMVIGSKGFATLLKKPKVFLVIPIKLIFIPICVYFILTALNILSPVYNSILTTFAMIPSMVVVCILAKKNGSDEDYATSALLSTTIASLATMPMVVSLINMIA